MKTIVAFAVAAVSVYRAVKRRYRMWTGQLLGFNYSFLHARISTVQKTYISVYDEDQTYFTFNAYKFFVIKEQHKLTQYQLTIISERLNRLVVGKRLRGGRIHLRAAIPNYVITEDIANKYILANYTMDAFCKNNGVPKRILKQVLTECRDQFYKIVIQEGRMPANALEYD